ncbi:MAG: MotA/TolQ/ExbB proton channel family protein [Proteobacteria bacterium]|nr:MotA/TolQ/ExbB proton channel family protein [Pseudomonadota bacterium]MBU4296588.1 MotA/TolQ/ExbB proton channel family protein [Pseudomonadota bacterium]MCG2748217.1 MotA/TolQ/ExbB proton channel family protein [Desulfobulbaceae bacterium]
MKNQNIIGLICCSLLFLTGFLFHGNMALYFNLSGALVVFGGTLGATLITYRLERLKIVYKVLVSSYRTRNKTPEDIVEILLDLSVKSKFKGILSLQEDEEETSILFLRRALGLLVDGYRGKVIRDILNTEMYFFKLRREDCERVIRTMGELFPSFGLVGSVVGLIGMLSGVGDSKVILATVPIALTSTLYGVVLANFFCVPFAGNIRERTDHELLLQKIIMEGVIAIESEMDPRSLERKLHSFVTPSSRNVQLVSLKRIQERFQIPSDRSSDREEKSNIL